MFSGVENWDMESVFKSRVISSRGDIQAMEVVRIYLDAERGCTERRCGVLVCCILLDHQDGGIGLAYDT